MARLIKKSSESDSHSFCLEIRPWVPASTQPDVGYFTHNGFTGASAMMWAEVIFSVSEAPLFYTHFLFHTEGYWANSVEQVLQGTEPEYSWLSLFPTFELNIKNEKTDSAIKTESLGETASKAKPSTFQVELGLPLSALYGESSHQTEVTFTLNHLNVETVREFAWQLEKEMQAAHEGNHPHPATVPREYAAFPFAKALNARAYDKLERQKLQEIPEDVTPLQVVMDIFTPYLTEWRSKLPESAHVLDVGCGDGRSTLSLLESSAYRITGIDVSAQQLSRARQRLPEARFLNISPAELNLSEEFDGAFSLAAFLHLDPIELRVALWRLHRALKPGGQLLIVSVVENQNARYAPLDQFQGEAVWQWYYSPAEVYDAVEEWGLFKITSRMEIDMGSTPSESKYQFAPGSAFGYVSKPREPRLFLCLAQKQDVATS